MNNKDKIIRYMDNQLNPEEKQKFEEDLKNSPGLFHELEKFKETFQKLNEMNIHPAVENYFASNIPAFREKLEKRRKVILYKQFIYASSAAAVIILVLFLFLFRDAGNIPAGGSFTAMNEEQLNNLAENYNILETYPDLSAVTDSVWDELISDEFNFSAENADSVLQSFNGSVSYADYLNEEEASLVYSRLINKEFF